MNLELYGGAIEYSNSGDIVADTKQIIDSAQKIAHQAVNVTLVQRNWLIGMRIVEEELAGETRSELYGRKVVPMLVKELTREYGKGFTRTSLYQYAQFYRMFPEIVHLGSGQSFIRLTWTHYRELLKVEATTDGRATGDHSDIPPEIYAALMDPDLIKTVKERVENMDKRTYVSAEEVFDRLLAKEKELVSRFLRGV